MCYSYLTYRHTLIRHINKMFVTYQHIYYIRDRLKNSHFFYVTFSLFKFLFLLCNVKLPRLTNRIGSDEGTAASSFFRRFRTHIAADFPIEKSRNRKTIKKKETTTNDFSQQQWKAILSAWCNRRNRISQVFYFSSMRYHISIQLKNVT